MASRSPRAGCGFDVDDYLNSTGSARRIVMYERGATVFVQGAPADAVMYLQLGTIKVAVVSSAGREAVVATLAPGRFFGEEVLAGHLRRSATATAMTGCTVLVMTARSAARLLRTQVTFAERFIQHMLAHNACIETSLVDVLFNSCEKRLARTLLLSAGYGGTDQPRHEVPMMSVESLAARIGATRSRVRFFMHRFRKFGFIDFNGRLTVNRSLLTVVLSE